MKQFRIDLPARFRNKATVAGIISATALLIKLLFGIELPVAFDSWVEGFLGVLTYIGVFVDPTTPGISD